MKIFVTGVCGQLGHDVIRELLSRGHEPVGSDIADTCPQYPQIPYVQLDITDRTAVREALLLHKPDAVINPAAWTAVDLAEEPEHFNTVRAVNAEGPRNLAHACRELDCPMLHISTDYVFSGEGTQPWDPDCATYAPVSVYGQTKLEGEQAVAELLEKYYIVRIAWAFGKNGNNFVRTMLNIGKKYDTLRVVNDQIGTPTYTGDLARLLVDMIETDRYGCYHATSEGGYISWYDFACEIFRQAGYPTRVTPVTTAEYGQSKARRPLNSRLDRSKLTRNAFTPLPHWQDALKRYLKEIEE